MSRAFTEALLICMKVDSLATISTSFRKSAKRILPVECAGARLPPQTDPHITPRSSSAWQHFGSPDSGVTVREVHPLTSLRNPYMGWAILHP